jgi:hypothetical protein
VELLAANSLEEVDDWSLVDYLWKWTSAIDEDDETSHASPFRNASHTDIHSTVC